MKVRLSDGSGFRHYKYLYEDVSRHGQVRVYFWRSKKHKRIRLRSTPGTPEFHTEYMEAFYGKSEIASQPINPGTLRWLCTEYYKSSAFKELEPETQTVRRRILEAICQMQWHNGGIVGSFRFSTMQPQSVAKIRDEKSETPDAANSYVKALRQLFAWACDPEYGHAENNPAAAVKYLRSKNPDGHKPWTEADVLKFEARWPIGSKARLALDLFLYTGVRISDVVRLGKQMEKWFTEVSEDGTAIEVQKLVFTEKKGSKHIVKSHSLPILPALRASVDATDSAHQHLVYLPTMYGKQHSVKGFGNWFKRCCQLAGIDPELSAHGIRKYGAIRCVENGATAHQLMALYGWRTLKETERYTKNAERKKLESEAAPLLRRDNIVKLVPQPSEQDGSYLYVIGGKSKPVKIGVAADPNGRLHDLQVGSPKTLTIIRLFLCVSRSDAINVETQCKLALSQYRIRGEWFAVSAAEAAKTIEATAAAFGAVIGAVDPRQKNASVKWHSRTK